MWNEKQLDVYVVSVELAKELHRPLVELRKVNRELEDQARRALMSIVLNVAEGAGKFASSRREQARYYSMARGSTTELLGCLDLCDAWELLDAEIAASARHKLDRIAAMLCRLIARA